jgi:FkbM family methyltransferase
VWKQEAIMTGQRLLIEVGAFDGKDSLRFHRQGYRVFTFEPNRDLYLNLLANTRDLEGYTVLNEAVCLEDGKTDLYICREGGASSILPFKDDRELERHWTAARTDVQYSGTKYAVACTRLDTFLERQGLADADIDYLHCDAQGADLDVLKSLGKYVGNVKEGVIESAYSAEKAIYRGQNNTVDAATAWLQQHGFEVVDVAPNDETGCECNIRFRRRVGATATSPHRWAA